MTGVAAPPASAGDWRIAPAPPPVARLFPQDVSTAWRRTDGPIPVLPPQEAACVRHAVEKRRREFAAGRACARRALARLGLRDVILVPDDQRVPLWPPRTVGSITHCAAFAAAAVACRSARRGIGLDVEELQVLDAGLIRRICTEAERAAMRRAGPAGASWPLVAFCAKEAVYKCVFPAVRIALEHGDVEIVLQENDGRFTVRPAAEHLASVLPWNALHGRVAVGRTHVCAGIVWT